MKKSELGCKEKEAKLVREWTPVSLGLREIGTKLKDKVAINSCDFSQYGYANNLEGRNKYNPEKWQSLLGKERRGSSFFCTGSLSANSHWR